MDKSCDSFVFGDGDVFWRFCFFSSHLLIADIIFVGIIICTLSLTHTIRAL